ncbi:MAG: purine-binding chemotaxis protein CheW [Candidatus Riflebacteria bacterium]|nr:purine-binding chemotaxis protein CheW [Candidatus Riflebacteria bacterium]
MTQGNAKHLLTFNLAEWFFGMPLEGVQEVQRMVELASLPQTPGGPRGVINLRGETVPVWELRAILGFSSLELHPDQNIIITSLSRMAGGRQGWIVDQVHEVVDPSLGQPAPFHDVPVAEYLTGVIRMEGRLVLVLEIGRILKRADELARAGKGRLL